MNHVKLVETEIDVKEVMSLVSSPSCGAVSMFVGTTRDIFEGKTVKKLVYEAYEEMAISSLNGLCEKVRSKWSVHGIAIFHRLGEVPVQEASVAIAISSVHRAESLEAVQFAIDMLKAEVPIWKKEEYEGDAEPQWKENKECMWNKKESLDSSITNSFMVSDEETADQVSPELIQLRANNSELKRRMDAFFQFKREQVNQSNIRDFCHLLDPETSCARVRACIVRHKDSKGHLRVQRVLNKTGPQTRGIEQISGVNNKTACLMSVKKEELKISNNFFSLSNANYSESSSALEERLHNAEVHLRIKSSEVIKPVPKDVYSRLQELENRILFLEGISPEYSEVLRKQPKLERHIEPQRKFNQKKVYSVADLDLKLKALEQSLEHNF